jgi:hypothetical protein
MTASTNGYLVIGTHIVPEVTFNWRKRTVTTGPLIVDCYLLLGGSCKGFHFQLQPN